MNAADAHAQSTVQDVLERLGQVYQGKQLDELQLFAQALFSRITEAQLAATDTDSLTAVASHLWQFGQQRKVGELLLRVYNPNQEEHGWTSEHTIIEMINDDMPFLVDTTSLILSELDLGIAILLHPIYHVERDAGAHRLALHRHGSDKGKPESVMHIHIQKQSDMKVLMRIEQTLTDALNSVRLAVRDWSTMQALVDDTANQLAAWTPQTSPEEVEEYQSFLRWVADNHFIFLGCRDYDVVSEGEDRLLQCVAGSGLGILQEKSGAVKTRKVASLSDEAKAEQQFPLLITKTNARSQVHRAGYMDYIGVLKFDAEGQVIAERRILGLFTSNAYNRSVFDTPLVRRKAEAMLDASGLQRGAHAWKALIHILETLPRDELFQGSVQELSPIAMGILGLQERKQTRLFIRRERFGRFYSCLAFIPRERFNTENREKIQDIIKRALKGDKLDYVVQVSESILARLHMIVRPKPGRVPEYDVAELEHKILQAVRSWHDELEEVLLRKYGEADGHAWGDKFLPAFPAAYIEDVSPWVAGFDVENMAALESLDDIRFSLYRPRNREGDIIRFKVFKYGTSIPLSDVLPMLENLGLRIVNERPYCLSFKDGNQLWVQDYDMVLAQDHVDMDLDAVREPFQQAFEKSWRGLTESDGFNRLILAAQLHWRQVVVLRAYCKYLLQTGIPYSQQYMENTLARYPLIARILVELFDAYFNPQRQQEKERQKAVAQKCLRKVFSALQNNGLSQDTVLTEFIEDMVVAREHAREAQIGAIRRAFLRVLESVKSLDEDRILRAFFGVISATLRTSFYQTNEQQQVREYISFKLDSSKVPDLPKPKPFREIWVYSARVEGVHLRGGKVARGGLRWSDRREDFRTEVLGLMKAQNVKNTMIVPVGAKGGFVIKRMPDSTDRETVMAEVVHCYRSFIHGLLDITDNLNETELLPPADVIRRDEDDPYLVVAADKGTATFSDIANSVAEEHGFWLGDAFASGGSVGYDHKGMGITAKGAWESVKRHFREMGVDTQTKDFSVVGIGDMAGDVFGNGMLLSKHIRLQAAFNHLHIFLDPDPDPGVSFQERERLFALPRSSWEDYNQKLISKGGGIFSRQDKAIPLSPEVRQWLDIEDEQLSPHALIRELLKAPVDLLWNGGIGTYVKSSKESHANVGDLANNPLRVNGNELRCKVIGEGGNLGCTQLGRIEFAQHGGRINTDFIDNSAGVDCSDHEVNIKILLNQVIRNGDLELAARNDLLAQMTDEVSDLVLRSNYLQTQAISMMERLTGARLGAKQHFISVLEDQGVLDRELEFLPDDEELTERRLRGEGLTRPELSVLLSYSKITLYQQLLASDVPEDPYLSKELVGYFPEPLQQQYAEAMPQHRLKREIIATQVTNSMVNRMGATFALRMHEDTGAGPAPVAKAYTVAREVFDARGFWAAVEALDNQVDSALQTDALLSMWNLLRQVTRWLLTHSGKDLDIQTLVKRLAAGVAELQNMLEDSLTEEERERYLQDQESYMQGGFPQALAQRVAILPMLTPALDIVEVAARAELSVQQAARCYFKLGDILGMKWLRRQVESLKVGGQWHAHARGHLRDELFSQHRRLTGRVLREYSAAGDAAVDSWAAANESDVQRVMHMLADMRNLPEMDYATISVAVRALGQLGSTD